MTTVLFITEPRVHAMIDDDANLLGIWRRRGIMDGAILARDIRETLDLPRFDGSTLFIDSIGLLRLTACLLAKPTPVRSVEMLERRIRRIVMNNGWLNEMIVGMRSLGGAHRNRADQAYFARRVAEQYARQWPHLRHEIINRLERANRAVH